MAVGSGRRPDLAGAPPRQSRSPRAPSDSFLGERPIEPGQRLRPRNLAGLSFQAERDKRLQEEIKNLTVRYSGDAALARRIAEDRAARNFSATDPNWFEQTVAKVYQPILVFLPEPQRADLLQQMMDFHRGGNLAPFPKDEPLGGP